MTENTFTQKFMDKYIPKKYREAIQVIEHWGDAYDVILKDGYIFNATGCKTSITYSIKELLSDVRTIVKE